MRWSAEKLRWLSLGGALLLAAVVAAFFGLASFRAGKVWQRILARNGVHLTRETNGFTYSQSQGGRTIFTLHAAKAVPNGPGHWSLHDAVLILYGKNHHDDRIYGSQFEYDQTQGIARAVGVVHMDLQVPASAGRAAGEEGKPERENDLSFATGDGAADDPTMIHVETSGLVYVRKLGTATTDQPTAFAYKGMRCTSRGAAFDSDHNLLHLLADVHLDGTLRNEAFSLAAEKADLDRSGNLMHLSFPRLRSGERSGQSQKALIHLRSDGSIEAGQAAGAVEMRSGTETLGAPRAEAQFGAGDQAERVVFTGGVRFEDADTKRVTKGAAETLTLLMNESGRLRTATAEGAATLHMQEPVPGGKAQSGASAPRNANGSVIPSASTNSNQSTGSMATRALAAKVITAAFAEQKGMSQPILQRLHMVGSAMVTGETPTRSPATTLARPQGISSIRVEADDLTTDFGQDAQGNAVPTHMVGVGHTQSQQAGTDGAHQQSTADRLDMDFALQATEGAGRLAPALVHATQTGHVVLQSWPQEKERRSSVISLGRSTGNKTANQPDGPTVAHAERASFDDAAGTLTLTGTGEEHAKVTEGETVLQSPTIVLQQGTGDGEASGGVTATTAGTGDGPATHVLAAKARLFRQTRITEFFGTDLEPAQMWQGSSQVDAARLALDGQHHTLAARPETKDGVVHLVLAKEQSGTATRTDEAGETGAAAKRSRQADAASKSEETRGRVASLASVGGPATPASRDAMQVTAAAIDFNDLQHEASFTGHVRVKMPEGEVTGDRGVAFLHSRGASNENEQMVGDMSGKVDRVVVLGDVHIAQPGRLGTGTQLTYTAATSEFVLTGSTDKPPRVHDVQQGVVTGATLIFTAAEKAGERGIVVAGTGSAEKAGGGTKAAGSEAAGKQARRSRVHTETEVKP